jgi:hypothetical protein
MKVDGQCFCGDVTFVAEIDPAKVELCHCSDCQQISSSAFRIVVPAEPGSFELKTGTLSIYVKTAESGNRRDLAFCPKCGTAVYSGPAGGGPGFFGLRVGCLNQRHDLMPKQQYWRRSALPWVDHIGDIPMQDTE